MIGVKHLWNLMSYSLVTFVFTPFYRSPFIHSSLETRGFSDKGSLIENDFI